jgi:hypothetical protein
MSKPQTVLRLASALRAGSLPLVLALSLAAGIGIGYLGYRPAATSLKLESGEAADLSVAKPDSFVRLRGIIRSLAQDDSSVTVQVPDMYDNNQTYMLTVNLDTPSEAKGMSAGQQVFVDIARAPGLLHARQISNPSVI